MKAGTYITTVTWRCHKPLSVAFIWKLGYHWLKGCEHHVTIVTWTPGGGVSILRCCLTNIRIPIIKISQSHENIIFIMEFRIPGKLVFILRRGPVVWLQEFPLLVVAKHKCLECGAILPNRLNLKKHLRKVHQRSLAYTCPVCRYNSNRPSDLCRHLATRHPNCIFDEQLLTSANSEDGYVELGSLVTHLKQWVKHQWYDMCFCLSCSGVHRTSCVAISFGLMELTVVFNETILT